MKLRLERTPERNGLIYKVSDPAGKAALTVECEAYDFDAWTLHFRSENRVTQAVMRQNTVTADFQYPDGKQYGRVKEARFSVAGKAYVEDEASRRLGSISSGLAKVYFKDVNDRQIGLARQTPGKGKFGFLPPSQAHRFWNHELEFEDGAYDERFLYALVCFLVTSEFGSSSS